MLCKNDDAVKELRNELTVLMEELNSLAVRNEELLADREEDAATIRRLQGEAQEYKRRWEATKTDLRNLKGELCCELSSLIYCPC